METLENKELGMTIVQCFRQGREAEANENLTKLIDILSTLKKEDLQKRPELPALFLEMLQAQQKRDVLHLADIIQYQLFSDQQLQEEECCV